MKSLVHLYSVLMLLVFFVACGDDNGKTVGENLLNNGSFEEVGPPGGSGWQDDTIPRAVGWYYFEPGEILSGSAHNTAGTNFLRTSPTEANTPVGGRHRIVQGHFTGERALQPGETMEASVWIRTQNLEGTRRAGLFYKFWVADSASDWIAINVPSVGPNGTGGMLQLPVNSDWTFYSTRFVVPEYGGNLQMIIFSFGVTGGTIDFDDLQLRRVNAPSASN